MVNVLAWLLVGAVVGWLAGLVMDTDARRGVILNIVVGIVGAALAGWLITPLIGVPTINQDAFNLGAFLVSFLGAIVVLSVAGLLQRVGRR